jgi:hypothetical protein
MKHEDDDDTQVYADTLLIVYQRGFADGKRAAQRKPLTLDEIAEVAERMEATDAASSFWRDFARAIEAAHNIKEQS